MSQVLIRRTEGRFQAGSSRSLFERAWIPAQVERVIVIVHGFGEHCGRYEELASWLAERGCAVHAYDQQGHGLSPGRRGHAANFTDLLDDLAIFLDRVQEPHSGPSLTLLGHSMGGLVVSALACERDPEIDLLITSGAALSLSPDLSGLKIWLAKLLRRLAPKFAMDAELDVEGLSRDPLVVQRYIEDSLVHGRMTAAMAASMIECVDRTAASASRVGVPMLLLHGAEDRLCLCAGSEAFYRGLPHSRVAGSEIRTYPNLRHEIFNEPEREMVYKDLLDWILRREEHAEK